MDQWWANELWDFTHIITKHSSPNEYILFFRGLILHTNLIINALIEVLMTFKSYEGFSGHWELLDSGLCDVLVVSTPNMTHYEILMDIINHPKPHHVLVEKTLCTTVAHCKEVSNLVAWSSLHRAYLLLWLVIIYIDCIV